MAPFTLIVLGIIIYIVNQRPDFDVGFRGLPWLDVPSALVVLGGLAGALKIEFKRRRKDREARHRRGEL